MSRAEVGFGSPHAGGLGAPESGMELDVGDLFGAVAARWRLFPFALAFTLALAGLYILATPSRYAATMSFLLDTREHLTSALTPSVPANGPDSPLVENQMRLLTSKRVLQRAYEDMNLQDDPEFSGAPRAGLKALIFGASKPAEPSINQATDLLGRAITVKRADKSYVIDVETRASSPAKAERIAEGLASAFLATQAQFSANVANTERKWIDGRLDDLRQRLKQAEARLQAYRESKSLALADGMTPSEQQMKTANASLIEARGKRMEAEARLAQIDAAAKAGTEAGAPETSREALRSPLLDKLLADHAALASATVAMQATLGPRHPAIVANQSQLTAQRAQIDREIRHIRDVQRGNVLAARKAEQAAEANVAALSKTIADGGATRQELSDLDRQTVVLRDNYEKALAARENNQAEAVFSPNPVLISQPLAQAAPVSPKALPALIIAIVGALNLWVGGALGLEFLARRGARRKARSSSAPAPAPRATAAGVVTNLATEAVALPPFDAARDAEPDPEGDAGIFQRALRAADAPDSGYYQAVARLRQTLRAPRAADAPPPLFAVTAEEEGAGATTLALCLALLGCENGERVLVIDGNARRPTLSALLPYLRPVGPEDGRCLSMFAACDGEDGEGRVLLGRFNAGDRLPLQAGPGARLDLILLDCGADARPPAALRPALTGFIEIDRDGAARVRRAQRAIPAAA
ncbi:GumC family protein [Rhodoblastus acidophilus]|nr:GumC family protein [Rhodoblastus acidophilus]